MSWKLWLLSYKYRCRFRCMPCVCYASMIAFLLQDISSSWDNERLSASFSLYAKVNYFGYILSIVSIVPTNTKLWEQRLQTRYLQHPCLAHLLQRDFYTLPFTSLLLIKQDGQISCFSSDFKGQIFVQT